MDRLTSLEPAGLVVVVVSTSMVLISCGGQSGLLCCQDPEKELLLVNLTMGEECRIEP